MIYIVGAGVVGQATGKGLALVDDITFLDINVHVIASLQEQGLAAKLVPDLGINDAPDVIMICVSTPPDENGAVNLAYIKDSMTTVRQLIDNGSDPLVVVRSTVPPGSTLHVLAPMLGKRKFELAYNPEFLRAQSSTLDFAKPWATVIGTETKEAADRMTKLYTSFTGERLHMSIIEAELLKYVNNLRNATLISFNNEMWSIAKGLSIDPQVVLDAATVTAESAWNPKYGSAGGAPYGGTCLPKDTVGLLQWLNSRGVDAPLLRSVIEVNDGMELIAPASVEGPRWTPHPKAQA